MTRTSRSGFWALGLLLLAGCGGGSGGDSAGSVSNPGTAESITIVADPEATQISFHLASPTSTPMAVDVEYSEDRGLTYASATIVSGAVRELETSPSGLPHQLTWSPRADLSSLDQGDLIIRVTPRDEVTGLRGASATSSVFALGDNSPPTLLGLTTPAGTVGGQIPFDFMVVDPQDDVVELTLEYSTDGGASWRAATPGALGDGRTVVASATGAAHTISWFAQLDAPQTVSANVRFRVTPADMVTGAAAETEMFSVNLIAPRIDLITIGRVPATMNGSTPYLDLQGESVDFKLTVPSTGSTLRIEYSQGTGGGALDPGSLSVVANRDLGLEAPAGSDLGSRFTTGPQSAEWSIDADHALPTGDVTFSAVIHDEYGNTSDPAELTVRATEPSVGLQPFDIVDRWWLDHSTDFYAITWSGTSVITIESTQEANGVADFLEDLRIIGLRSEEPTIACAALGSNDILLEWSQQEILGRLRELYGGSFDGATPGYSPQLQFSLTPGGAQSAIRIGGDDSNPGFTIGRAQFDLRNGVGNDNRAPNLGVFTTNLIDFYINSSYSFQARFNALIPGRGTPAGEHALDHIVLDPGFARLDPRNSFDENARYDEIAMAIDAWGRAVSVILSHEIGHSIGLVANGPPPSGLFGGVREAPFAGAFTNSFHLDSPGSNLMSSVLSFSASMVSGPSGYRFNDLNQAYLREWTLLE